MNASSHPIPEPPPSPGVCGARRPGYVLSQLPCISEPHADGAHVDVHGVSWPVTPEQAAAGVMAAEMARGHGTAAELAAAEQNAGLLFDPQRADDIALAAREQAAAEYRAEVEQLREYAASLEWFRPRLQAVIALCAGRPDWHAMTVREILAAADAPPAAAVEAQDVGAPLHLAWDRIVMGPSGDSPRENTLVPCHTSHGVQAALVLDDEQRLGGLLLASLHAAEACTTTGCGATEDEIDAYAYAHADEAAPDLWGWIQVRVHGTDGPPRWWCSSWCANSAIAAAAAELAAADRADAQAPAPLYGGNVDEFIGDAYDSERDSSIPDGEDDDEARCSRCGCTENSPCEGGCVWVPSAQMVDLCSGCVPAERTAETGGAR